MNEMNVFRSDLNKLKIKFGITNLDDVNFIERNVVQSVVQKDDIALLKLDRKVFFQPSISPICFVHEATELKGNNFNKNL